MTALEIDRTESTSPLPRWLADYLPIPGAYDEMVDAIGSVRPHWSNLARGLTKLGTQEMERRFAASDRFLRDSGVFYRVYEDTGGAERPWPLSHIPLIIEPLEWEQLQAGLTQRADLLEKILADVYGPATLVRERRLPAAFVAGNPDFLRPLAGITPSGGAHLRIYAADLARAPDGRWWVLRDRTQAPSGIGYALENRLALRHGVPDLHREARVRRHAPFFQAMQSELTGLTRHDESRVCVLTPGPMNETYFEHAFLARYLGFLLVEGEDLTVRDNGVFIRTVSGLKRADVLMRRLDADFIDPLELNARSRLGIPGLTQAVRDGKVVIANSLGSGFAEARGLLAFLPALSEAIDGRPLAIPNVATWWLGDPAVRERMHADLDETVVASAYFDNLPNELLGDGKLWHELAPEQRRRIEQTIADRGADVVLQEPVRLSTMPVWHDGRLEPRPFILRVYLTRQADSWAMMPGGFVRVGRRDDIHAISLQRGALTADAWIPSDGPIEESTLLPNPDGIVIRRKTGTLPSRAADNLFWLGRYIDRTEATLRLVRALLNRMADNGQALPVINAVTALVSAWSAAPSDIPSLRPILVARAALENREASGSVPALVMAARNTASVIRDRLSPDAWRAVVELVEICDAPLAAADFEAAMSERVDQALRIIASFSGLAQENMTRLGGWRFLEIGRRIERGVATCRFTRQFSDLPERGLDTLLELCDSRITYRQRYMMVTARAPVIDLAVLDPSNPRSIVFQLDQIETHLDALPHLRPDGRLSLPRQIAMGAAAALRTTDAAQVTNDLILATEAALMSLSESISATYLGHSEQTETHEDLPA
jgi:uncharacterized circularly permuted ATP-grasp superfamily protein/uncharacterized alpha-E superfamily protein